MKQPLISHTESKVALVRTYKKRQNEPTVFSQGHHELIMNNEYVTGSEHLSAPHTLMLISPFSPTRVFTLRRYFPRFTICLRRAGVSSFPISIPVLYFVFRKKREKNLLSDAAVACVRGGKRRIAGEKQEGETAGGRHFDVQGASLYTL